jgi:hypothetical protein
MDKNQIETLLGLIGGSALIYYAAKKGSPSPSSMGSFYTVMFDDTTVIERPTVRNRDPNLGRQQDTTPAERPNRQRYKIFWDCVTRYSEPNWNASGVIGADGGYYGELLRNTYICDHNEGDEKWANCATAAQVGVTNELGRINFEDMMNAGGNITGYECVLAAMPVDDNGQVLPHHLGMPLSKHTVVAAYADAATAIRNWGQALPLITSACAGGDIYDIDNYMRT